MQSYEKNDTRAEISPLHAIDGNLTLSFAETVDSPIDKSPAVNETPSAKSPSKEVVDDLSEFNAAIQLESESDVKFDWPRPFVEDFDDDWPNLNQDDALVERELLQSSQLLLRVVTWNLCARPPPAGDVIAQNLIPPNR